eukprot:scaffold20262_cov17-Tisochrysis_lutea.AAC.1
MMRVDWLTLCMSKAENASVKHRFLNKMHLFALPPSHEYPSFFILAALKLCAYGCILPCLARCAQPVTQLTTLVAWWLHVQVVEKDLLIQEKEKLYMELKNILSRQPGPEVAEQLSIYQ